MMQLISLVGTLACLERAALHHVPLRPKQEVAVAVLSFLENQTSVCLGS